MHSFVMKVIIVWFGTHPCYMVVRYPITLALSHCVIKNLLFNILQPSRIRWFLSPANHIIPSLFIGMLSILMVGRYVNHDLITKQRSARQAEHIVPRLMTVRGLK